MELGERLESIFDRSAVDALVGHGVVRVHDPGNACTDRDLAPRQSQRIAAAVVVLVVRTNDFCRLGEDALLLQDLEAFVGMGAQHRDVFLIERSCLVQDVVGDGDLAQVMQRRTDTDLLDEVQLQPHLAGHRLGQEPYALGMTKGRAIFLVDEAALRHVRALGHALDLQRLPREFAIDEQEDEDESRDVEVVGGGVDHVKQDRHHHPHRGQAGVGQYRALEGAVCHPDNWLVSRDGD